MSDSTTALQEHLGTLARALETWATRDSKPQPEVRRAANTVVDAIDGMLRELYLLRGRVVREIRQADDTAMRRGR